MPYLRLLDMSVDYPEQYLLEEWRPLGWMQWWYDFIPLAVKRTVIRTIYYGHPHNGLEQLIIDALEHESLPGVWGVWRVDRRRSGFTNRTNLRLS